jgi:hypothetical protein
MRDSALKKKGKMILSAHDQGVIEMERCFSEYLKECRESRAQIAAMKEYIAYLEECEMYNAMVPPEFACEYPEALLAKGREIRSRINPENLPNEKK